MIRRFGCNPQASDERHNCGARQQPVQNDRSVVRPANPHTRTPGSECVETKFESANDMPIKDMAVEDTRAAIPLHLASFIPFSGSPMSHGTAEYASPQDIPPFFLSRPAIIRRVLVLIRKLLVPQMPVRQSRILIYRRDGEPSRRRMVLLDVLAAADFPLRLPTKAGSRAAASARIACASVSVAHHTVPIVAPPLTPPCRR